MERSYIHAKFFVPIATRQLIHSFLRGFLSPQRS